jgi:hypothetical protein
MITPERRKIYCAGAYSADNVLDVFDNMRRGISVSARLFKDGFSPFCPFLDYHYLLVLPEDSITLEMFYQYSLDYLRCCDAMFIVNNPRNEQSVGVHKEIDLCESWGIKVFTDYDKLLDWARVPVAL